MIYRLISPLQNPGLHFCMRNLDLQANKAPLLIERCHLFPLFAASWLFKQSYGAESERPTQSYFPGMNTHQGGVVVVLRTGLGLQTCLISDSKAFGLSPRPRQNWAQMPRWQCLWDWVDSGFLKETTTASHFQSSVDWLFHPAPASLSSFPMWFQSSRSHIHLTIHIWLRTNNKNIGTTLFDPYLYNTSLTQQ